MKQPNAACADFCNWMLNISKQHLSGPQRSVVNTVFSAAIAVTPISDQVWYNFNLFSAWRNKFYVIYRDYASTVYQSLLTNLVSYYNMEGNSNDAFGGVNFTDTGVSYGLAYGKILQGQLNPGGSAMSQTVTRVPLNVWSVNFWVKPLTPSGGINVLFSDLFVGGYVAVQGTPAKWVSTLGSNHASSANVSMNNYQMVTVTSDGTFLNIYANRNLVIGPVAAPASFRFTNIGFYVGANSMNMESDMWGYWSRVLTPDDIDLLWNGGAGIQYPF